MSEETKNSDAFLLMELDVDDNGYKFASDIKTALSIAEDELSSITSKLEENIDKLKKLTPDCDKTDYILAACCGALSGIIDVFLVGKPGESILSDINDKWVEDRVINFANRVHKNNEKKQKNKIESLSSAIRYLEKVFKVPYDQTCAGNAALSAFDITLDNHHFKSLGHNPNIMGLFFSILDQFTNTSHFVHDGELFSLQDADGKFELKGNSVPGKIFCGITNWFGHLMSDEAGSSGSKGRGMGIPSPFWCWINDVIAIKSACHIPASEFDKSFNKLAVEIYEKGFDARFQTVQTIPVFINEIVVRTVYSVRRLIKYFITTEENNRSFLSLWKTCEPFINASVKRMLTVAHGTFCLVDVSDAVIQGFVSGGGSFNFIECVMRLNISGIGRFEISLFGEFKRGAKSSHVKEDISDLNREKVILEYYVDGLNYLAEIYDDEKLLLFTKDFIESGLYVQAFEKTVLLAEKRKVPDDKILKNKTDIDAYFKGENG